MPGNAGGGKGPHFRCAFEEGDARLSFLILPPRGGLGEYTMVFK